MPHEWLTEAWLRAKALLKRKRLESDLEEELEFHLAMRAEKNRALGIGANDAKAAARRRFGNVTLVKEDCRETWTFTWMETLWQDVRYAARILAKSPGFAAVVIFSLALGIGANTAVFSVMNTVLFHPLPYEHPERLATIWCTQKMDPGSEDLPPVAEMADWKKQNHVFADIAAISLSYPATLTGIGEPGPIPVQSATPNFFALVGVRPALGRVFRAEESQEQFQTVLISNSFWKNRFNSDPWCAWQGVSDRRGCLNCRWSDASRVQWVCAVVRAEHRGNGNRCLEAGQSGECEVCEALGPRNDASGSFEAGCDPRASTARNGRHRSRNGASSSRVQ